MHVLITGAAGFIGSHLVDRYLADGHSVTGIDNFLTGNLGNLGSALKNERFAFVEGDVCTMNSLPEADLILHFASPASPIEYGRYSLETLRVNSLGTDRLAHHAMRLNARFLFASTSESYGDPLEHPQTESYWGNVNPVGVRSCYDESKRFGEALVVTLTRTSSLDGRLIRIFNTYGPRMQINDGRVVPNFVGQALRGEALTIYGDGAQTRSFCYVDDLVGGILRCASSAASRGIVTNLGNPEEHSIMEFAEIVCRIVGVPLRSEKRDLPPDDPTRRCPDISRAREMLGWGPVVSLEDGLRLTIGYFADIVRDGLGATGLPSAVPPRNLR